ncbi:unnamed protein product [Microthlaspi erraticum]|uniref:Uncharacterized protein n=1 Tax=Microthlaspi erraticum TaxID=1685480 RepID=A0A6D2JNC1_9BRAS|nr:unnamed protein product [Microthlaspi erraticum]
MTVAALRHVRQIAQATTGEVQYCGGRQPAVLTFKNFQAETAVVSMILLMVLWMMDGLLLSSDGGEDITIMINSSSSKFAGSQYSNSFLPSFGSGVLCAKASMLLQVRLYHDLAFMKMQKNWFSLVSNSYLSSLDECSTTCTDSVPERTPS